MKFNEISFGIVGGDLRQIKLANYLAKEQFKVKAFGFQNVNFQNSIEVCDYIDQALKDVDIVIGPIPCSQDDCNLYTKYHDQPIRLEEVFKYIPKDKLFMAGRITEEIARLANHYSFYVIDLLEREELAILNAIPTAEGAIQIAMENSQITIHGSQCLVLGYGRCGKILSHMLHGIGAKVSVEARKLSDLAYIKSYGYDPVHLKDLDTKINQYDFIFNTIPSLIIDQQLLQKMKKDCLIIDLASRPGGVDFQWAQKLGINAKLCLSLPGKVAPDTAAVIIKETIVNVYNEMGVIL